MMKKLLFLLVFPSFLFFRSAAQNAPALLTSDNITSNSATIGWIASSAIPSTVLRTESFEQPFGTSAWSSGGYDWFFDFNDDIRDYNGGAHTGTSSWAVRGYTGRSNLFCNIPLNIKGLWAKFFSSPNSGKTYTIKGFSANGTELYSKTVTPDPSSFNFVYVTLDWQNVKRLNIAYAAEPGTSLDVDDIEYTPAANAYPYYLSTNNAAPGSNTVATSVATGTTINLNNLQPATTYYLWMRTYNGDTYGNWTPVPITFTTEPQVLPVQLTAFNAKLSSNTLMLDWQTASEKNSSHFLVQLSKNGSAWTDITKVASKAISGDSATSLNYTFSYPLGQIALAGFGLLGLLLLPATRNKWMKLAVALVVIGSIAACAKTDGVSINLKEGVKTGQTVYVRLAQVDLDGTITYSQVVPVKM